MVQILRKHLRNLCDLREIKIKHQILSQKKAVPKMKLLYISLNDLIIQNHCTTDLPE